MSNMSQTLKCCLVIPFLEPRDSLHHPAPSKHAHALSFPWSQQATESTKTEQFYVHHPSFSPLTSKSLEMCTESLGNESGNDLISDFDGLSRHALEKKPAKHRQLANKKTKKARDFPPPLTSIGGSEGILVQTYRESGRLVGKAFNFSSPNKFFRAERENGRLRLSLVGDFEMGDLVDENENEGERDYFNGDETGDDKCCYWGENGPSEDGGKISWCGCRPTKEAAELLVCAAVS